VQSLSVLPSDDKVQRLALLCKVWGFLKYYHPVVRKGEYDWDNEFLRVLPLVTAANDKQQVNTIFLTWINHLGKFKTGKQESIDSTRIKLLPDLSWIEESNLIDEKLRKTLHKVRLSKKDGSSYYVKLLPGVKNPEFLHETEYSNMAYSWEGMRLLGLFRYWNMIQYYFPYRNLMDKDWESTLEAAIPKFINASNEVEYKTAVLELCASVDDSHAVIIDWGTVMEEIRGKRFAPYEVSFIENKAVVTNLLRDSQITQVLMKGDIILSVDSKKVDDIVKDKLLRTSASNYPTKLRNIAARLLTTNDSIIKVVYDRDGKIDTAALRCNLDVMQYYATKKTLENQPCYREFAHKIGYIYATTLKKNYVDSVMSKLYTKKGIIIDLRCYPTGNFLYHFSFYLHRKPASFARSSSGSLEFPGLFMLDEKILTVGMTNEKAYSGKIIILVNELTQSAAEFHAMAFKAVPNSIIIGSTTSGADGNASTIILPGKINTMITGIGIYYPDGGETQRIGIVPDIVIRPTIKGVRDGKDEVLLKAIDLLNNQN
jgi:C-terminal processing protease CtpA/Prc